jgi:RHS repeat-associated protein
MRSKVALLFLIAILPQFAYAACTEQGGGSATCTTRDEASAWVHDISRQLVACDNMTPVINRGEIYVPEGNPGYYYVGLDCGSAFYQRYIAARFVVPPANPDAEKNNGAVCPTDEATPTNLCSNPINVSTGNKFQAEKDFSVSPLLEFIRYYNSDNSASTHLLGLHWTNTYSRMVKFLPSENTKATLLRPDGQSIIFNLVAGVWTPDADQVSTLQSVNDINGQPTGWVFKQRDDREIEDYDSKGRLISIGRSDGSSIVLIYNNGLTENNENDYLLTRVTDQDGRYIQFAYDPSRRISSITHIDETVYLYQYDAIGNLQTVTAPGSAPKTYLYNESAYTSHSNLPNALTGIIDETGQRYATYSYLSDGRAVSSAHAGAAGQVSTSYSGEVVTITLPNGAIEQRTFTTILGVKKPTMISTTVDGVVRTSYYTYDVRGRADVVTDALGTTTDYDYDAFGNLTQKIESANKPATKRITQSDRHPTLLTVPIERRVYNAANVLEAKTTYAYNNLRQVTALCEVDPGNSTAMSYVCGSATNAPVGVRQTTVLYCETAAYLAGTCYKPAQVLQINGPRTDVSDITTYYYYPSTDPSCPTAATPRPFVCPHRKGDLWKVTNALNQVVEYTLYDLAGHLLSMKDENNVITDFEYNIRGWPVAQKIRGTDNATEADDAITRVDYNELGNVTKVTQPDSDFVIFNYDAASRLTSVTDALNNSITYTLDSAGNPTAGTIKDTAGNIKRSLSRVYDTLGRLQISKNAASSILATATYDANDNINTVTDGLSRVTDQDVDPLNRLIKTIQDQGAGKINATTQFEYDARDNLTKVIDPKSLNTVYTYNGLNDLTQLSSPDTGNTLYTYDAAGNRKTQTDARNKTSTYSYDIANRLTQVTVPTAAQNVYFDYDATQADCQVGETFNLGRMTRIRDESGSTRYCFNRLGQPVRKVQAITSGPTLTLGSTYNAANRTIAMTYPSGAIVTYLRNAKGQITNVSAKPTAAAAQVTLVSNATYLPFGPLNTLTFGNARVLTKAYDQNYDIDKVSDSATDGLSEDSTVNVMGNITAMVERTTGTATATRQFAYDNMDRLLSLKNSATNVQSFTYDATGNRLSKTLSSTTTNSSYPVGSHRLTTDGTSARTYDANGNTATLAAKSFVYDDRNRLRDYINSGSTVTRTYRYNGKGERVSKVQSAGNTNNRYYFYDEAGHLLGEYLANGTRVQEYVWLDDTLVAVLSDHDASTYQFVETDHLGTPRVVVHPVENNIVWRWNITNTAFGEHTATNNPDGDAVTYTFNLRYPGQMFDAESGLHYNRYRDYEPGTGRYPQSDPMGLKGGISSYGYVGQNPLTHIDPHGLCRVDVRFKKLGPGYYHAYIVSTEPDGSQTYFRGGPSAAGPSSGSFGAISSGSSGSSSGSSGSNSSGASNSSNSSSPGSGRGGVGQNNGPFGPIVMNTGPYRPGTVDWQTGSPPSMNVLNNNEPCGCNTDFAKAMRDIQNAHIPYNPLSTNSNATVREALERSGFNPGEPPVWAPGWETQLP